MVPPVALQFTRIAVWVPSGNRPTAVNVRFWPKTISGVRGVTRTRSTLGCRGTTTTNEVSGRWIRLRPIT